MLKLNQVDLLFWCTNVANEVWSFVRSEFSSVGREEWYDEMKDGQKLKIGDSHVTPRHIQEVQASVGEWFVLRQRTLKEGSNTGG